MNEELQQLQEIKEIAKTQEMAKQLWSFGGNSSSSKVLGIIFGSMATEETVLNYINELASDGSGNLLSIHNMIEDIVDWQADYFGFDGYGNFCTLTRDMLEDIIEEVEQVIED